METQFAESRDEDKRDNFPSMPISWYYFCRSDDLDKGPAGLTLGHRKYVAYRDSSGRAVVLNGRCVHLGADLSRGCVVGDSIKCPFHEWEFGPDGRCVRIPSTTEIPSFARQTAYPVCEMGGHVFFFNRPNALFPLPFYPGLAPEDLYPAKPFDVIAETQWYLVGANAFDMQHFRSAHDRTLVGEHVVDCPTPFSRRIAATFDVTGTSIRDRLTRVFSGPQVRMTITDWCGNFILVTAEFRRTTSYGLVTTRPLSPDRTLLRIIVWVRRGNSKVRRMLFDPIDAYVRRSFIRAFVQSDADRSAGVRYRPGTLIDADKELADYFLWLQGISRGQPMPDAAALPMEGKNQ